MACSPCSFFNYDSSLFWQILKLNNKIQCKYIFNFTVDKTIIYIVASNLTKESTENQDWYCQFSENGSYPVHAVKAQFGL